MQDALLAIAMIITGPRLELSAAEVQQRFAAQCVDGKWEAQCPALRTALEVDLYGELRALGLTREPVERDVLVAAARGYFPPLVEQGLRRLEKIQSPEEREAVRAAVEHPSPGVRSLARRMLDLAGDGWSKANGHWWADSDRQGWDALVPDTVPLPEQIGLQGFDKLRYRFFASRPGRAVFTSRLPPDAILGLIARGAKPVTGAELAAGPQQQKAFEESMKDVERQMRAAMAKGDFRAMQAITERMTKAAGGMGAIGQNAAMAPVKEFPGDPASLRYVQLDGGQAGRFVYAAVGRDEALGETVLVIHY